MLENLPEYLIEKLKSEYDEETFNKIIEGYSAKRKTTFRINTLKTTVEEVENKLKEMNIKYSKPKFSNEAIILDEMTEVELEKLDMYNNGEIYVQSLSSMLPPIVLEPQEGNDILDMAAAPGGKTTQIAALTNNKAHITACEMNNIRMEKLKYNLEKQGAKSVFVMQKDSRLIDDFFKFNQILLDAPCTGTGTITINDKVQLTPKFLEKISKRQIDLLNKSINILKPGSTVVYSTCSILKEENEMNIKKLLQSRKVELLDLDFEGIDELPKLPVSLEKTLCVCPTDLYEGFFVAKIKKLQ